MASVKALAAKLLAILDKDRPRLYRIDDYLMGYHDDPYMPSTADDEYKLLAQRAVANMMPLLVSTPAQALYVDGIRRGKQKSTDLEAAEWDHWQRGRWDARQSTVYRGALGYGHCFTVTERNEKTGRVVTKGLSALNTAAVFEDSVNDEAPYAAIHVLREPGTDDDGRVTPGKAEMWDETNKYLVYFKSYNDPKGITFEDLGSHEQDNECPVTRFACAVDLEGRTIGVIEPYIPLQNRINQTVFDLLVAQTYGSFKVRWATGMAPPIKQRAVYKYDELDNPVTEPSDGFTDPIGFIPELDENGEAIPKPVKVNASRMMFAEDHEAKFGTLDETPLSGYIESIDMSMRELAASTQTPPHYLLGQVANLSAEALQAAETSLARKIEEFKTQFGESWERVFRLAAALNDDVEAANDYHAEVHWRDMESRSLAQAADALGKLAEQLGIPRRGLWSRVPDVTEGELARWEELAKEDDPIDRMADAMDRAAPSRRRSNVSELDRASRTA